MLKIPITRNQIWKNKRSDTQVLIYQRKGIKWRVKILTNKTDVYSGSHTLHPITLYKGYELIKE